MQQNVITWCEEQLAQIQKTTLRQTQQRVDEYIQLQQKLIDLPIDLTQQLCICIVNVNLCWEYYYMYKRYAYTPFLRQSEECLKKALDFDNNAEYYAFIIECYKSLAEIYLTKNHLKGVIGCCQSIYTLAKQCNDDETYVEYLAKANVLYQHVENLRQLYKPLEIFLQDISQPSLQEIAKNVFDVTHRPIADPIEQSERYLAVYDEAEKLIQDEIERVGRLKRLPEQYFSIKKRLLAERFGIDWKTPREINPKLRF